MNKPNLVPMFREPSLFSSSGLVGNQSVPSLCAHQLHSLRKLQLILGDLIPVVFFAINLL